MIINRNKRIFGRYRPALLVALLLFSLVILFSCSENQTDIAAETSEITSAAISEEATETETPDITSGEAEERTPLSVIADEYTLIYGRGAPSKVITAAKYLSSNIGKTANQTPKIYADSQIAESGKELLVGETNRSESIEAAESLNYMDYTIRIYEDKIVVVGGSPLATEQATRVFSDMLQDGTIETLKAGFVYDYDFDRYIANSLAYNTDSFVPKWTNHLTPPAWMLDYEEKIYAVTTPEGRIFSISHRGDLMWYPENSLEGILSAIMMGADCVEIDIRLTKDNVMVLMHDETLTRTTDWKDKAGRNGLPKSDKVADWTYEELRELRLLHGGKATDLMIPTAYEALLLFPGRTQIQFDNKVTDRIDKNTDVYLLAEETGTKDCFFFNYGYDTMLAWLYKDSSDKEFRAFVKKITIYCTLNNNYRRQWNFSMLAKNGDNPNGWKATYNEGYTAVYTDIIYRFCRYAAENDEPINLP